MNEALAEYTTNHFTCEYFQKSMLIFGLIAGKRIMTPAESKELRTSIINTYLFSTELDDSILDNFLLCEMHRGTDLQELSTYLVSSYTTEDGNDLHIFDVSSVSSDVNKFLQGMYSKYSEEGKKNVLNYYGWMYKKNIITLDQVKEYSDKHQIHLYVFFYPNEFKEEFAQYLCDTVQLYDNYDEAYRQLNGIEEFCKIYDEEKETLTKKLIGV